MLPIAVEIAPPDAPREQVTALLTACSRAIADSECVLASEAPEGGALAVAIVTWQSDGQAFVEVGMRRQGRPEWRSRTVSFGGDDEVVERWRTVGFVVGTLARGEAGDAPATEEKPLPPKTPEPAPVQHEAPRPPPPRPRVVAPPPRGPARAALDLGAEGGPGLGGKVRSGGSMRTRWPFQEPLRAVASLKYLEQNNSIPKGSWLTVGAGLGGVLGDSQAELSASLDLRGEYFHPSYDPVIETRSGSAPGPQSRLLLGLGSTLTAAWMPMPNLGLYIGVDGAWMFGSTEVHLKVSSSSGKPEWRTVVDGPLRIGATGGLRLRLW
jgi:hypothetical protein